MITMKFGGTSVGDLQRLQDVASIVHNFLPQHPVVVASAMSGVTNLLLETAQHAVHRDAEIVKKNIETLKEKHLNVANTLLKDAARHRELINTQTALFDDLTNLYRGVSLLKELSARSLDAIASYGEILSCLQIAALLKDYDVPAEFIDARTFIRTDRHFGEAAVDFAVTNNNSRALLLPKVEQGIVPVITGFIASTDDCITTTLGRSGSDYTGSIIGAALDSEEIWIWTDVDGVMTADPRYVSGAKVLPEISYREAAEMSYFGAKVIHPKTMMPAIEKNIPIRIKNTFNPPHLGTLISKKSGNAGSVVKNITSIDYLSVISIEGNGMMGVPGISARIFSALARIGVNVMMISQASSEHNVCFVVPDKDCEKALSVLRSEFDIDLVRKLIDDITVQRHVSIVAVVGEGMKGTRGIAGKTFTAVADAGVNLVAIAQGSSELNISFVVDEADVKKTVQAIHDVFHLN
ncbi:MAG: aspartate kinase [Bacteroidota bacterium]|nr:aspartate kinase [Bacteroidota bacterium]